MSEKPVKLRGAALDHVALADVKERFADRPVPRDVAVEVADLRAVFYGWARQLVEIVPRGPEREAALDRLEESMLWSIAGLVRPERPGAKKREGVR